ncbi:hypothetical protein scyTo_0011900 [Scyliorhinus torazame]|uniref:Reverse transcriptase domain-containing protein n=1 Tax=Scyliorhinus torazame TaxID=75743 RepID=A0A401NXQ8_SCYTO|nr:hypothetical protein [Scyliorhinus torazame]
MKGGRAPPDVTEAEMMQQAMKYYVEGKTNAMFEMIPVVTDLEPHQIETPVCVGPVTQALLMHYMALGNHLREMPEADSLIIEYVDDFLITSKTEEQYETDVKMLLD